MPKKRITDIINDKIGTYASPINTDEVWSSIEPRVPRKKSKKRYFLWFLLGFIGMMVLTFSKSKEYRPPVKVQTTDIVNEAQPSTIKPIERIDQERSSLLLKGRSEWDEIISKGEIPQYNIKQIHASVNLIAPTGDNSNDDYMEQEQKTLRSKINLNDPNTTILPRTVAPVKRLNPNLFPNNWAIPKPPKPILENKNSEDGDINFASLVYSAGSLWDIHSSDRNKNRLNYGIGVMDQSIRLNYGRKLGSGFYVLGGMGLGQSTFKYKENIETTSMGPSITEKIIRTNKYIDGAQEHIEGNPSVEITNTRKVLNYNSSRRFILELGMGYQKKLSRRLALEVYASLAYNYSIEVGGKTRIDGEDKIIAFKKENVRPILFRYNIGGQVLTPLRKGFGLLVGITASQDLHNRINNTFENNDVFRSLYGQIGIRKQW